MRLLGVDFGFKRIGLAVAETDPGIVSARPSIEASGKLKTDAEQLASIARREEADLLILGLPIEETGDEGRMARICRTLAGHIAELGIVVELVDERYTSTEADRNLREISTPDGKELRASQRRKLKDGEAARLILERFMTERGHPRPTGDAEGGSDHAGNGHATFI